MNCCNFGGEKMTESEYFKSNKFKEDFRKKVEEDTWEKGKPMIYLDDNGNIVEHWKDGTIKIIKEDGRQKFSNGNTALRVCNYRFNKRS